MVFDEIAVEDTAGYEAYQLELEVQEYLESDEFREELNRELAILSQIEKELNSVDFIV